MRSTQFRGATAAAMLVAGSLLAAPAYAKNPPRPYVAARSSVVIPLHGCQSTAKWLDVMYAPRSRVDSAEVVSVRKRGYTFPVSRYRVCGAMGSGTYTVKSRVRWSVSRWRTKWAWNEVVKDVDVPFTCTFNRPPDTPDDYDGVDYAYYECTFDDGREWDEDVEYYDDMKYVDEYSKFFWVHNLPIGWRSDLWNGSLDVYPPDPWAVSEWPLTLTGAVADTESHYERYKKRVRRWIKRPTFTVKRVVEVTVR